MKIKWTKKEEKIPKDDEELESKRRHKRKIIKMEEAERSLALGYFHAGDRAEQWFRSTCD